MGADIITLQEVQKDAFDEWFKPELAADGYDGLFQQKKRDPIFHRGKYTSEGCATFWRTSRFKRVEKHIFDYDRLSQQEVAHHVRDQKQEEKVNQRLSKGNIALAVIVEDRHMKNRHGAGHQLCVVNTHILCDPAAADVKLWQSHLLIKSIQATTRGNMPTLVCGDFNSTPDSAVYDYFRRGQVRENHEDLKKDPCGLIRQLTLQHNVALATAYETCTMKEATFTNYTEDFKGTLDYIWFTPDNISVLAISQVDDEAELSKETALPSSTRPSDHVSLVATFMFQDPTPEQEQQQMGPLSRMLAQTGHGHRGMGHHLGPHYGHHGMHPGTGPGGGEGMYMGGMPYPQNYL